MSETIHEWHLGLQAPWGRPILIGAILCALAVVLLAAWGLRRERRRGRRWLLLLLRSATAAVALALCLEPALVLEDVTRVPNHVAVLVDASESMRIGEQAGEPSRGQRAAMLVRHSGSLFRAWRAKHAVDFYTFGSELGTASEELLGAEVTARAPVTRLREALAQLRSRYEGRDLGGVVVISDGIDHGRLGAALGAEGTLDPDAEDFLRGLGVPVHTVWAGRAGLRDVTLARILADDFAFARNVVKVEAVVRVSGAREAGWMGRRLPVTLKRDGAPIDTDYVVVESDPTEQKVSFEFTPERVGKYVYEVATPVLEGEALVENNTRHFLLKVIRDKIRVLQIAGRPSWDERFLRGLLKRDPNVDLISFFILRTPTDVENVLPDEMSLIPFPTQELFLEQLRSFDVVFLQNFNFEPYGIGPYLREIKHYVDEGGGLVMLGGDLSFSSGAYAGTPVAEVLPVELLGEAPPDRLVSLEPFRPQLTAEGKVHPVTALRLGAEDNRKSWEGLPPLDGCNLVLRARPGATTLLAHPSLRGGDGRPLPVLAVEDIGKGRSLAFAADSTWRWGFSAPDRPGEDARGRAYQRFWENAIRWLIRDPELRLVRVEAERTEYGRGEPVRLVVRVREPDYRPARGAEVVVSVEQSGGKASGVGERVLRTDEQGGASLDLGALPPGGYRVTARRTGQSGAAAAVNQDDDVFVVRSAGLELEQPEARPELLRAVAQSTGGSFRTFDEGLEGLELLEPRVVKVSHYRERELWSTWASLALAAVLLGMEWVLRRRWGMA